MLRNRGSIATRGSASARAMPVDRSEFDLYRPNDPSILRDRSADLTYEERKLFDAKQRRQFFEKATVAPDNVKFSMGSDLIQDHQTAAETATFIKEQVSQEHQLQLIKRAMEKSLLHTPFLLRELVEKETVEEVNEPVTQEDGTTTMVTHTRTITVQNIKSFLYYLDSTNDDRVTEDYIRASNKLYSTYSKSNIDHENLQLSHEFLYNCCAQPLQQDLDTLLLTVTNDEKGALLTLWYMLETVHNQTANNAHLLLTKVDGMKLSDIPGEDVRVMCNLLTVVAHRLDQCNATPRTYNDTCFAIMVTSSVGRFRNHFYTLKSTKSSILDEHTTILNEARQQYTALNNDDAWLP